MQAVPLTLAARAVKSNHVTVITQTFLWHLISVLQDYRHDFAVRSEIDSRRFVFRTWDVLNCLIDKVPDSQTQLEV